MKKFLRDGLLLRRASAADTEALVAFNADVLRHQDAEGPDPLTAAWTRDLLERRHPSVDPGDFIVVEDPRTRALVSSMGLISQTWAYGGIAFGVGQPELIGTHPAYRGRGLVREQFDVLHQWSTARGHVMQAIDGIPWFYRQFGYEMALSLRAGRIAETGRLPAPGDAHGGSYRVRPAAEADLPFIAQTYEWGTARYLATCCRDQALWRYELCGRSEMNMYRAELHVVEVAGGRAVGFLAHLPRLVGDTLWVKAYELEPGVSWHDVTPSVLRYLRAAGGARGGCRHVGFWFDTEHPSYPVMGALAPQMDPGYAWYIRIANLPDFVRRVAPVLHRRLSESALAGFTGELRITFYRDGIRLAFRDGRLTEATPWRQPLGLIGVERGQPTTADRAAAAFPGRTFLQLLLGFRSLEEIEHAFADCLVRTGAAHVLLQTLFPKQASDVWAAL
jgi:hypothetical protein